MQQLFHARLTSLQAQKCVKCQERFPSMNVGQVSVTSDVNEMECVRCSRDKHVPKIYSTMNPGSVPLELMVCVYYHTDYIFTLITDTDNQVHIQQMSSVLQDLTQVEEMLVSAVMLIVSIYCLPHGQYGYSGHVINLP